jgi:hypothetical protein
MKSLELFSAAMLKQPDCPTTVFLRRFAIIMAGDSMNKIRHVLCCLFLLAGLTGFRCAGQASAPANPQTPVPQASPAAVQPIPEIDGGVGPCSLELTVTTTDAKPAGGATVKVHIAYRLGGFHKLDLSAGANVDGKVRFIGLPSSVHRPPLEFKASKDQLVGTVTYDPEEECHAKHGLALDKPKAPPSQ